MAFKKFHDALLKAVDFTFNSLGESCRQALYFHLKTTFHLGKAEIPEKVGEFDNAIRLIFKDGAVFLENLILEKLCDSLGVEFEENDTLGFVEAVSKVRNMVSERESLLAVSDFSEEVAVVKRERGGEKLESEG
jgi:hypothetical protein